MAPRAMSIEGLTVFRAVLVALASCTTKTMTKPMVRLTSRAPARKPRSSRFGLGRKSITVTAASRVALAAETSERRKMSHMSGGLPEPGDIAEHFGEALGPVGQTRSVSTGAASAARAAPIP